MNALRMALVPLICIIALVLAADAVDLTSTGTNTATGSAVVQGDVFRSEPDEFSLYSGAWAHVWIPAGNDGVNAGDSQRIVQARAESRQAGTVNSYTLTTGYGDSSLIAKASKAGVLGTAEAFSEASGWSTFSDIPSSNEGHVYSYSQLTAYVSHSGTGTANAYVNGSSDHEALMDNGVVQSSGSASGSAALNAANNYGGYVTGAAFKVSASEGADYDLYPFAASECFDYLSLESGRYALDATSIIDGIVSGDTSANGSAAVSGVPGKYALSESSLKGNLSAIAATYKLGDSIKPSAMTTKPVAASFVTQLDSQIATGQTGITAPLYTMFLGGFAPTASAYMLSWSKDFHVPAESVHEGIAQAESFTSSGVTRTLADSSEAYGASYISNGAISTASYTSSAPGNSPITLVCANADEIFMGSGAHMVSRLTGVQPASTADLTIDSKMNAAGTGSVKVNGGPLEKMASVVGPSYSPSGTPADATGIYLEASGISGTAVHVADPTFTAASNFIADDIDSISIWSWASGDDPISHAESSTGLRPFVSTPKYTSEKGAAGVTKGPTVTSGATATTRSIDTVFSSSIASP